ncbi:MAG: hypothetical protein HOP19_15850 [Acidobacteria bacterium]|nr:hypothetical protein [Acidobacteriota bacterium]
MILPTGFPVTKEFEQVGTLVRKEASRLIVGYTFDLRQNTLTPETVPNPAAGREHTFQAWRLAGSTGDPVALRATQLEGGEDEDE